VTAGNDGSDGSRITDLFEQLTAASADRYLIERELGRDGEKGVPFPPQ
jgi:hypothetical protein